jgi:hypothetical protein
LSPQTTPEKHLPAPEHHRGMSDHGFCAKLGGWKVDADNGKSWHCRFK